jgi:hypothetical protein
MIFRQRPGEAGGTGSLQVPVNGRLTDGATSGNLILSEIHSEPQTQNVFDFSHRQPFLGQLAPSTSQWKRTTTRWCPAPFCKDEVLFRNSFRGCE